MANVLDNFGTQPSPRPRLDAVLHIIRHPKFGYVFKFACLTAIAILLGLRLWNIGWREVLAAMPSSPTFYLLSLAIFCVPVLADCWSYPIILGRKIPDKISLFSRKQVLNEAVMAYVGEAFLVRKFRKLRGLSWRGAAHAVKDQTLIQTFISNAWLFSLAVFVFLSGNQQILQKILAFSPVLIGGFCVVCLSLCFGLMVFYRSLSSLPWAAARKVALICLGKVALLGGLQIMQWSVCLTGTELPVWMLFLAVHALAKKSPVSGDLIFLAVALNLPGLNHSEAAIAAMFLTAAATNQIVYAAGFLLTTEWRSSFLGKKLRLNLTGYRKTFSISFRQPGQSS